MCPLMYLGPWIYIMILVLFVSTCKDYIRTSCALQKEPRPRMILSLHKNIFPSKLEGREPFRCWVR